MSESATEPQARPVKTVVLKRIDAHGSRLAAWVIQHVATNADMAGIATTPLTTGSSCAAAINGIKKKPVLITSDVQSSGEVRPVTTEIMDTTATSDASISSATSLWIRGVTRSAVRSAQTLQHPTTTPYTAKTVTQIHRCAFGGSKASVTATKQASTIRSANCSALLKN